MVTTNFKKFFVANPQVFVRLYSCVRAQGYVTDEILGVTRCLFESVSSAAFEEVCLHHGLRVTTVLLGSTAIQRKSGEFLYVLFDQNVFSVERELRQKLVIDGSLTDEFI